MVVYNQNKFLQVHRMQLTCLPSDVARYKDCVNTDVAGIYKSVISLYDRYKRQVDEHAGMLSDIYRQILVLLCCCAVYIPCTE